jgi:L-malate glycosyltransferase
MGIKIKIIFITHYSDLYGANRSLLTLIEYFHLSENYEVKVLLPSKGTMANRLKEIGIPYEIMYFYGSFLYIRPKLKHIIVPILGLFNLLIIPFLLKIVRRFSPDLVYSNTSAENIGIFLAKILNIKHISHIREFMSLDHESYFIFGSHAKRKFIGWSDGVVFVSKSVSRYIQNGNPLKTLNTVIYNGLKSPKIRPKSVNLPTSMNFGIVGLIDPAKGQLKAVQYLNDILLDYPNSVLNIYGTGTGQYFKKLIREVKNLNLNNNVIFHGFVNELNTIYSFDILFMFSRSEGFGRVTVEAMMRGIPVIGFDGGGTTELIEHGRSGYLFNDSVSFKKSLDLLTSSPEVFNSIRIKAYEIATTNFTDFTYCSSVEVFIQKVLSIQKI